MKSPPNAAGEHHREHGEVAGQHHANHGRSSLGGERELLRLIDKLFQRRRWRLDAFLRQQCLIVEKALGGMTHRDADEFAVDRHGLNKARRDVAEILDRRFRLILVKWLEQFGNVRSRSVVDHEADVELGFVEAGFAEEPVLERV